MKYNNIQKNQQYGDRLVFGIYPEGSNLAGPGLDRATSPLDDILYQDFKAATRSSCTAQQFAAWATGLT